MFLPASQGCRSFPVPSFAHFLVLLAVVAVRPTPVRAAEPQWLEVRSEHFAVITDTGEKRGREIALRFEQMRAVFGQLLERKKVHMSVPLTIFAIRDDKQFYQAAPVHNGQAISAPGFFVPGDDHQFIVLNGLEDEPWRAVTHEFAHLLLNYNYPPTQGWFDEGFAEYFSSIRLDNKQVEIGSDPELATKSAQDLPANQESVRPSPKSLTELLSGWVWLSLPELFSTRQTTPGHAEGAHRTLFYAQSWITMHYLLNKDRLPATGTYFDLVENQKVPVEEAIQQAYGMSAGQLEKALKDYFHSLTQPLQDQQAAPQPGAMNSRPGIHQFSSPIGPDETAFTSKPLSEADARALLAEVMVRIPERREQGLKEIDSVLKLTDKKGQPVDNAIAHRTLAWLRIDRKEFPQAAEELGNAAALDPRDTWIRYYLSLLKYRTSQANHQEIQGLANMMVDLKMTIDWYPEFAEAYNMLAMARIEGGGTASALDAIRAAIALSPRNQQYLFNLALINEGGKKWDAARAIFERLKSSDNPQIAGAAAHQLQDLPTLEKYGIALNAPKRVPQSSPFDELEQEAQRRAAQPEEPTAPDKRPTQFAKGTLVRVDCSNPPAAILIVNTGAKSLKLRTADSRSLLVIGEDNLSCQWTNRKVSVNYHAGGTADGDLVSVEVQ
jgi:tetratricopeptide (TPR) repeat protein